MYAIFLLKFTEHDCFLICLSIYSCIFVQVGLCSLSLIKCHFNLWNCSGAPAGAEGARGRSSIPIEFGKPSRQENLVVARVRPYVRTYVRTYARIRPGNKLLAVGNPRFVAGNSITQRLLSQKKSFKTTT